MEPTLKKDRIDNNSQVDHYSQHSQQTSISSDWTNSSVIDRIQFKPELQETNNSKLTLPPVPDFRSLTPPSTSIIDKFKNFYNVKLNRH